MVKRKVALFATFVARAVQLVRGRDKFALVNTVKTPPVMLLARVKMRFVPARLKLVMTGGGRGIVKSATMGK